MNTQTRAPGLLPAITHRGRSKGKPLSLPLICLFICLSSLSSAHVLARETSPFARQLAAPPPFDPEAKKTDTRTNDAAADNQRSHPLVHITEKTPVTKRVSAKAPHRMSLDINNLPPPGAGSQKISQAIAASKKDEMIENEWKMGFELRSSPVRENHGNAERHDSIGGLIKGNFKF